MGNTKFFGLMYIAVSQLFMHRTSCLLTMMYYVEEKIELNNIVLYNKTDTMSYTLHLELIGDSTNEIEEFEDMYSNQIINARKKKPHFDSGFDLFCPLDIICPAKKTTKIKLGAKGALYKFQLTFPCTSVGYYLYPRSSISKTPLRLANSVGIIDSGYRGELMAVVDNISDEDYLVTKGQRLFQICAGDLYPITELRIGQLDSTARGSGGFGSTGK